MRRVRLGLVIVHVSGVVFHSWLHRENLIRAMITGRKSIDAGTSVRVLHSVPRATAIGVAILAAVAAFWFWGLTTQVLGGAAVDREPSIQQFGAQSEQSASRPTPREPDERD